MEYPKGKQYKKFLKNTQKRNVLILDMYKKGSGYQAIAATFGMTKQRVYQIVKEKLSTGGISKGLDKIPAKVYNGVTR